MRSPLALALLLLPACTPPPSRETGDSGVDAFDCPGDPPDLRCTQAALDRDYFWFAREAIEAASVRVHVLEYLLYEDGLAGELLGELVDAAARGVEVRVLADEAAEETAESLAWLEDESGGAIAGKLDSPSTTSHNKLIVADDAVLVGSHNVSSSALAENHEASVYVADPGIAAYYDAYFEALWQDSDADPALDRPAVEGIEPIKNREIGDSLQDCLDGAQSSVRLAIYAVDYLPGEGGTVAELVEGLVAAHERGLDVRVVLDQSEWIVENHINDELIALLQEHGVPLRLAEAEVVTHAKVLRCDGAAIVGDANWSYSSMELYNGTSIRVEREDVVAQVDAWFDALWDEGEEP